jgi:hypothetical protein
MKPSKALARRLSSLALAVGAIPGPALHAYPHPYPHPAPSAGPGAGVVPGRPMRGDAPGGWVAADPDSALVRSAATFAAGQLGEEFAGVYVVEDIHSAATQVVAGTNVALQLRIARVQDSILGARKECGVVVYVPLGARPQDQLANFTCQSVDSPTAVEVPM